MNTYLFYGLIMFLFWPALAIGTMYLFGYLLHRRKVQQEQKRTRVNAMIFNRDVLSELIGTPNRQQIDADWIVRNIQSCKTHLQLQCCEKMIYLFSNTYPGDTAAVDRMLDAYTAVEANIGVAI